MTAPAPGDPTAPTLPVEEWWAQLTAAALLGTERRPAPALPSQLAGLWSGDHARSAEERLLDAAAVGGALRAAGRRVDPPPAPLDAADTAPDDDRPIAPPRARQLLHLLLRQPPVGAALRPLLLRVWLAEADRRGVRAGHDVLPDLLDLGAEPGAGADLRVALAGVLDRRGRWLAGHHVPWRWALPDGVDGDAQEPGWALLRLDERLALLARVRVDDPARGRALVSSTWDAEPAAARAALLGALRPGIGPDDEPLLEQALDDRARSVRAVAVELLDALPGSARAARLGALLAPLMSVTAGDSVHVELPTAPDAVAVRDGLGPGPRGRSQRGYWLEQLAAGAPFATWTEATRLDPAGVCAALETGEALAGLRRAALARRDATWAAALLDRGWDGGLLALLPAAEREAALAARLPHLPAVSDLHAALAPVAGPWSPGLSRGVVAALRRAEPSRARPSSAPGSPLGHHAAVALLVPVLATRLDPSVRDELADVVGSGPGSAAAPLHDVVTFLSLVPTVTEAFA